MQGEMNGLLAPQTAFAPIRLGIRLGKAYRYPDLNLTL